MRKKNKMKIKNRAGFSLTELLVVVLILGMVSSVVAGGIPVAKQAYTKVTVSANAQVLLSTTISALRSELGPSHVSAEDNTTANTITYLSGKNGTKSKIYLNNGVITIQEFLEYSDTNSPYHQSSLAVAPRPLSPGSDDLYATYSTLSYDNKSNMITIVGLTVKKQNESKTYADPVDISIRVIGN